MKQFFSDWRVLSVIAIVGWGAWGILLKFALKQLDWRAALLVGSISALPLALALGIGPFTWRFDRYVLFAALAGIGALVAALAFNRAIQKGGSLNVVVPLTSQYVLVIVVFSIIFFNEPLTWKRIVGIAAAIAAIVFLSL